MIDIKVESLFTESEGTDGLMGISKVDITVKGKGKVIVGELVSLLGAMQDRYPEEFERAIELLIEHNKSK